MTGAGFVSLLVLIAALAIAAPPLGRYLAAIYADGPGPLGRVFGPVERLIYRIIGVDERREQTWKTYAYSLLGFSLVSVLFLYLIQRVQQGLPLNPLSMDAIDPALAFNTAVSFVTNTNWQNYAGETTMSHFTQTVGLAVQNFVSAAVGMAVAAAFIRGIVRRRSGTIGNFWVDLTRTLIRVLIPLSIVLAIVLVAGGVVQNFTGADHAVTVEGANQLLPGGPLASQSAIKQVGTNGGGFFNANSIHPFESPTGFTNFVELFALLLIPFAFPFAFGKLAGNRKQGLVLAAVMFVLWFGLSSAAMVAETAGNPELTARGADQSVSSAQGGGNMEGKDVRIGSANCGLFAGSTTGTSTGAVDCQHDSMTPLGGGVALAQMQLGEVSPGGVGVGINGLLINALLAVFIAGLMVGRTPEFLGKKIQAGEMKLVVIYIVAMPLVVLGFAAASVVMLTPQASILNPGAHGFSEVLYATTSAGNNNGSAFGGLTGNTQWFNTILGICMLVGRFVLIVPTLAIAGSLARKTPTPATAGTFPTNTPIFVGLVLGVVVIVAGLTFFPALALGPIVEQLHL
jgi:K+-transporting ATPase ATPase A chain